MATSLRIREERPLDLWRENRFLSHMESGIDRLFGDFFGGSLLNQVWSEAEDAYSPNIDVKETTRAVKIAAEMPGIDEKDIDVSLHDGILTISGEKKLVKEEDELGYHRIERSYGCFTRDIALPDGVEGDKVGATFKNGVLTITVPKAKKAVEQSRKIPITTA